MAGRGDEYAGGGGPGVEVLGEAACGGAKEGVKAELGVGVGVDGDPDLAWIAFRIAGVLTGSVYQLLFRSLRYETIELTPSPTELARALQERLDEVILPSDSLGEIRDCGRERGDLARQDGDHV